MFLTLQVEDKKMKVILAIDGSTQARSAAMFLARLPHDHRLDLVVTTIVNIPYASTVASQDLWYPEFVKQQHELADQRYQEIKDIFEGADVTIRQCKSTGHIGHEIVECAKSEQADLIVLGATGHSVLHRVFLGSVSDYVATHSNCSVMIVRPREPDAGDDPVFRMTLAYDDSPSSQAVIEQLLEFQWCAHVRAQVLSVAYRVPTISEVPPPFDAMQIDRMRQFALEASEKVVAQLKVNGIHAESKMVEAEHVGQAILDSAAEFNSQMIVLGDTGHGPLGRIFLGSVSRFVIHHAARSVWIVRKPEADTDV
jgi:nucleotide-binding universal stress UspA family protein